jgi:uncharacterized LabA/DUF88 family protein
MRTYYFNAPVDRAENEKAYADQQRFFRKLYDIPNFEVVLGRLEKHNGKKVEKGVDVRLAVTMLARAYKDHYDVAVLVSGDADFVEAVQEVKDNGKHVELAFFDTAPCFHLRKTCDRFIVLNKSFLEDCWIPEKNSSGKKRI